jgi:hypothetical protein
LKSLFKKTKSQVEIGLNLLKPAKLKAELRPGIERIKKPHKESGLGLDSFVAIFSISA